jgi:AbrB family looped-hinge helix DNA binding protein
MGFGLLLRNGVTFYASRKTDDRLPHCYDEIMKTIPKTDTIRFTGNGQVIVPPWLRKKLGIKAGTRALMYQEGDAIVLKPITPRHIRQLRGSLKRSGLLKALMDRRKCERELK